MTSDVFVFPASFAQQRLWFLDQLLPDNAFYNMPYALRLPGLVDLDALGRSLNELVRRHESLRTTFAVLDEVPVQVIAGRLDVPISTIDLRPSPAAERETEARQIAAREQARPFDLAHGPLFRATVVRLGDDGDVLLLTLHHIISDGWSMEVLFRELSALYEGFTANRSPVLPELAVQYADFAVWQRQWLRDGVLERQLAYWRRQLAGAPAWLNLPTDHPRPTSAPLHAGTRTVQWSADRSAAIRALAQREGSTVFLVLLSAFTVLLARYSGQDDIVVGTPIANRVVTEIEPLIGFFVNTLALRTNLSGDPTFVELLGRVRDTAAGAFANQDVPFERVVAALTSGRDLNRSPLFQVMFAVQSETGAPAPAPANDADHDGSRPWDAHTGTAKFDLTLSLVDRGAPISGWLEYAGDLFDESTIERLLDHLGRVIDQVVAGSNVSIATLALLSDVERARLLTAWSATATDYPRQKTVHALFEDQVAATPDAIAAVYAGRPITYRELNSQANRLARHLRTSGARRDRLVGVLLPPSTEMVIALVATLKAGGAYVPLDPADPPERLRFMLLDAEAPLLITLEAYRQIGLFPLENTATVCLDADAGQIASHESTNLDADGRADDLAYVLYTSGSTGQPKGVAIEHRAIVRLVRNTDYLDFSEPGVFAQMSHPSFDAATFEIWGALLSGSTLVGIPKEVALSPRELAQVLRTGGVTTLFITTALFNQVAREAPDAFKGLRNLLTGGEANDPRAFQRVLEHSRPGRLVHVYGPTESTTFATWHHVRHVPDEVSNLPIGRPVNNTRAYVLDASGEPVAIGAPGELCLGGDGIARGYWRRPELTAERFVPDRYSDEPTARLYRTGDLVRYQADGALVFLGRRDEQIKIRGFRVEPGEIETALRQHPGVADAAVVVVDRALDDKALAAYLVARDADATLPGDATLRLFMQERLPTWMAPARFVWIDALPLTPSGKVDRGALASRVGREALRDPNDAPETATERTIAAIWQELLGFDGIGAGDRFFEIGGHSLLATQVMSRLRDRLGVDLPVRSLFLAPTLRDFAATVDREIQHAGTGDAPRSLPIVRRMGSGTRRTSFAQQRLWFIAQLTPDSPVYNVPDVIALDGAIDPQLVQRAIAEIVRRHEILRTTITAVNGVPMQVIAPPSGVDLSVHDWRSLTAGDRDTHYELARREEMRRPLDLARGPLLHARLLRMTDQDSRLLVTLHHAVADGWSLQVLRGELATLLDAFGRGVPSPLPELSIQYADHAEWQRDQLESGAESPSLTYWKRRLAGATAALELPADRPRPAVQTYAGAMLSTRVPDDVAHGLRALSDTEGATLFMTLLASFAVLLARYAGQRDLVVGIPVAGRTRTEIEPLIGLFVNTLALRIELSDDPPFRVLLDRVKETAVDAFAHQDLPFDRLVSELVLARDPGIAPLIQVLFDFQTRTNDRIAIAAPGEIVEQRDGVAKFELTLAMIQDAGGLVASLEYNTDRFDDETAHRLLHNFLRLLASIVDDPACTCSRLPLVSDGERQTLLVDWNPTDSPSAERCLPGMIDARVLRTPDANAILGDAGALTYGELALRVNLLARRLRARGVTDGDPVGLYVERTSDLLVALLGILKAGGAYVPLDGTYPAERLAFMLQDSGARLVVTQQSLPFISGSPAEAVCLDGDGVNEAHAHVEAPLDDTRCHCQAATLAAIVYTSGSTGRPKGVAVEHHSLVNLAAAIGRHYELTPQDRVLQLASMAFDVSAEEIFPTLAAGAAIVMWPDRMPPTVDELFACIERFRISVVNLPSPYWHAVTDALQRQPLDLPASLRLVVAGSDKTSVDRLRAWQQSVPGRVRWLNAYGTTETTVTSTLFEPPVPVAHGSTPWVPIGRPIANTRAYVLDEHVSLLPAGAPGELCLGGEGVARGYLNQPALTAERFVSDPFSPSPGARLYKTGDRARFRADGNLELLGRLDDQIKVRGFRIEPAEIERRLVDHPGIRDAKVVARLDAPGDARLVAYVVPQRWPAPTPAELRSFVQQRLPDYMVPAAYVALTEFPTTAAGKVDRLRLPAPDRNTEPERTYVVPRTPAERQLATLWAEVLGIERVGVTDNFFELGGDSILSIQIIARAAQLGLHYTPRQLFQHQTIAELAPLAGTALPIAAEQGPVAGPVPLTPIQHWFFEQALPDPHHYNQSVLLHLDGGVDATLLEQAFAHLVDTHDALRLRFTSRDSVIHQTHAPQGNAAFSRVDLRQTPVADRDRALERAVSDCQASLNLAAGPIAQACHIDLGDSSRLVVVVHHLAVDGVSWRIILDQLYTAYDQLSRGEPMMLPPKTTSFQYWAKKLTEYASSPALADETGFWLSLEDPSVRPLPLDRADAPHVNTEASARVVTIALERSETEALLHRVPQAYRTQVNDVLLCALARGFSGWTGARQLLVDLEGHGREPLFDDVDLTRTIGWFTTIFPVLVDAGEDDSPGDALKAVKEHLRRIPNKGIGFGLLRYLCPDSGTRAALRQVQKAEISFNYLGQFENGADAGAGPRIADEWGGPQRSPRGLRPYLLDITGGVYEGALSLSFMYSVNLHQRTTIEALAARVAAALRELIAHCVTTDIRDCTPSDFPLARLDQQTLTGLMTAHVDIEDIYPLSPMQAGLLFHTLLSPDAGEYVEQLAIDLPGGIDVAALERAWSAVVQRHPVLRTAFVWQDVNEPLQVVRRRVRLPWEVHDWSTTDEAVARERTEQWLRDDRRAGYDLADPPLTRFVIVKLPSHRWRLLWSCHHLLLDGWSVPLVLGDVGHFYEAFRDGREAELAHPRPYREYIAWMLRQDLASAETFWRGVLRGFSTPTPLVVDKPRTDSAGSDIHDEVRIRITEDTTAALQKLSRQHRLTLNTIVQAAWALLLSRYSCQDDVVFGATVSGRPPELAGVEAMVGLFINTLPVRVRVTPGTPLVDWLRTLQEQQSAARQFEYSPLVSVHGWSEVPRGTPLFESVLVFENYPGDAPVAGAGDEPDPDPDPFHLPALERTSYPVTFAIVPGAQLVMKITFDCRRLERSAVERMLGHMCTLLTAMAAAPHQAIASLPLLTDEERQQALVARNRTAATVSPPTCVQMFDEQVLRTPDALAVVAGDATLTYAELDQFATGVARRLQALGVERDVPVALFLQRGHWLTVGMLGILKAGGAYVPLATSYPPDRIEFMLHDTAASIVVTQSSLRNRVSTSNRIVICLDEDWPTISTTPETHALRPPLPESLAYIIYTSGSTGEPKGAALPHSALANLIWWQNARSTPRPSARVLQFAPVSFDVCFQECFSTWASGGTLVLVPDETQQDPVLLARAIDAQGVDRVFLPFVALQQLAETAIETAAALRLVEVITAGEQLHITPAVRRFFADRPGCTLHNQYGPSETHVATAFTLTGAPDTWPELPPIGWPIANARVYVLDSANEPVPVGVPGELYLAGDCLARGYWRRPVLTAERFVPSPHQADDLEARLYRTGDFVRAREDGALEFLGRRDDQAKIRGFRVEPGEIEAVLRRHRAVGQAVVVARETRPGDRRLIAYLVPARAEAPLMDAGELRTHLEGQLPDWMVPAAFVWLDRLPLTPSGKVDRRALPEPGAVAEPDVAFVAPRTSGERALTAIWQEVLGTRRVSVRDHFFELGGHSLLATRVVSRIRRDLGIELPLRAIFDAPVLEDLAERLGGCDERLAQRPIMPRLTKNGPAVASFGQQRLWLLEQMNRTTVFHIAVSVPVSGVIHADVWRRVLNEIVRRHEVLRTTFVAADGVPVQRVASHLDISLRVEDLRGSGVDVGEAAKRGVAGADTEESFDLSKGPLLRARLVRVSDDRSELQLVLHHSVADGWSLAILRREVLALGDALARAEPSPLPELPIQYADFAEWQRDRLQGGVLAEHLAYWRRQLDGAPATLDFPTDRRRPPAQSYAGAMITTRISAGIARELRALGQREGATLFMTLLSAFAVLLSRQTGQTDIVIGAPVAGRTRAETEPLIGFFLNHLPLRVDLSGELTFCDLVARVRDVTLGAYAHQELPFELLLEHLRPERHPSHTPVFQAFFNLLNFGDPNGAHPYRDANETSPIDLTDPVLTWSPFDFTLYAAEQPTGIDLQLVYRTTLYDSERMAELLAQFSTVLDQIARDAAMAIDDLSLVTSRSRPRLPDPTAPLDDAWRGAVHTLFAGQAAVRPGSLAVSDEDVAWTYAELDAHSARLAQRLRDDGIVADDVVAIYAHRSAPLVCAILGVMKAGATYIILDPAYPAARLIEYLELAKPVGWIALERAGAVPTALQAHLTAMEYRSRIALPAVMRFGATSDPENGATADQAGPDRIACISFTSGSTGKAKGVLQRHGPLTHFIPWVASTFGISSVDRFSMLSGLSHDPLQRDIFTPLALGASIHIPSADTIGTPGRLATWLGAERITISHLTPAMSQLLTQVMASKKNGGSTSPIGLRCVFFVGDKVTRSEIARLRVLAPQVTCVNFYGSTETQRAVGYFVDEPTGEPSVSDGQLAHRGRETLPAGRGIENVQLLVINGIGQLAGVGELGEIHVRSPHLALGYLEDPMLTRARFVGNPFTGRPGDTMYRTGDLGRYLPGGLVEFVGRADSQVKLRGFRVELAEVEARLRRHPQIRDVAVILRGAPPEDPRLAAYFVAGEPLTAKDLRQFVADRLPDYMIPSAFVALEALPMTPNGKLDRAALPGPEPAGDREVSVRGPRDAVDATLLFLWQQALGSTRFGIDDNFFELGGHSLLASQVLSRLSDACGVDVPLGRFFERPTIAELAEVVAAARVDGVHQARPPITPLARERYRARRDAAGALAVPEELRQRIRELVSVATLPGSAPDKRSDGER